MATRDKIRSLSAVAEAIAEAHDCGQTVVLCHGVFDLLHIGHIRHLEAARRRGDLLVVTVTPDRFVNKGPSRPAFGESLRAAALAALECVDFVAINLWPTAVETLSLLRPDVYVKGGEYRDAERDVTGGIARERAAVESVGGRLEFTDEVTFSSSHLLNRYLDVLPDEARTFLADLRRRYPGEDVLDWIERLHGLRVLVVGETIIDEYQYCHAIGKSSKSAALVARVQSSERFAGGIIAVANHLSTLCREVTVLSMLGAQNSQAEFVRSQLHPEVRSVLVERQDGPTIVKRRFIESYFLTPMFELYEMNDEALSDADDEAICAALRREVPRYDVVVVVDYGHCMLSQAAVEILCDQAAFLAMNTQANAGNRGYHRLWKYRRADYVCAAEHEIYLEARDWRGDLQPIVLDVAGRLACENLVVTCGASGALCYQPKTGFQRVPALAGKVVDRVGAGDAFLAVTAPLVRLGAPMELVGFLGNVAGAEAVATVGHRRYIDRAMLAKHVQALLA